MSHESSREQDTASMSDPQLPTPLPTEGTPPRVVYVESSGESSASQHPQQPPVAQEDELPWPEFLFRAGLLLGAGLFFLEGLGSPLERSVGALAAGVLSALIVCTMVFNWRVLGDWRQPRQICLYVLLALALWPPISAAFSPNIGASAIPNALEGPLVELIAYVRGLPGAHTMILIFKGMITFVFLMLTLIILVLGSANGRRAGLVVVASLLAGICLFFHPGAEVVAGFAFLIFFFYTQWEIALIMNPLVKQHLSGVQLDFLRALLRHGSMSTGETRLYLNNNPSLFSELVDFQLVHYDPIAREVLPGRKLTNEASDSPIGTAFNYGSRGLWIMIGIIYAFMPDLLPGPLDDLVVLAITGGAGFGIFNLFGRRRR